jgi:subtilase family serine protease
MRVNDVWSGLPQPKVSSWKRWSVVCAVVLAMTATLVSQTLDSPATRRHNRITQELTSGAMVTVPGTVHAMTQRATDLGAVSSAMQMDSLTLDIGLSAAEQTELDALLAAQQYPKSPQYHQWLTQEEYGARFGLTDEDLNVVTGWLASQGFAVRGVAASRNAIHFGGKAWQVESALHTQLHHYKLDDETHFANATEIRVPASLGSVLLNVRGLNNFRLKPHALKRLVPSYTLNTKNGIINTLTPADWATIYDVNNIYAAGYTGKGAYVGVVGQTYAPQSDIDNFRRASQLGPTNIVYVCIDPKVSNCTGSFATAPQSAGDLGEADLDIEWAGGIAKDATVVYVYAPYQDAYKVVDPFTQQYCTKTSYCEPGNTYNVFDALQHAVQDYKIPGTPYVLPVISMSYSDCEASFSGNSNYRNWVNQIGTQANAQGQTILVASGDSGGAECDAQKENAAYQGLYAPVPADSPYYTGVGGTTLSGDESSPSLYWNETLNLVDSAIQYIPETVWNDTVANAHLSASGGGVSQYYAQPAWQPIPSNYTGTTTGRFVPDVAFAASADHDGYMGCSSDNNSLAHGTMCANNSFFSSVDQTFYVNGGTSAATPSFAGMLTLLVQMQGKGFGNINTTLYSLAANPASYASVFHDIKLGDGDNIVPCRVGVTDPGCTGGAMGWLATTGYDLATGLGSIDGYQLYLALGGGAIQTAPPSTTKVTVSPTSVMQGASVTLSTTVSGSGATPTGNVTFSTGTRTLGPVALANGAASWTGAASLANGFAGGTDTIAATYGGSTLYSASSGTTSLTVTAVTYTLVASQTSLAGSSAVTLTLTSTNYAGTVTLTPNVTSGNGNASNVTAALSSPSVVLASNGSGASMLTIAANSSAAQHSPALPWRGGGAMVFAVLLSAPFTLRRRRALTVLLMALTISAAGLTMSCGGGGGGSSSTQKAARSYTVTVTAKGSGTVADPLPVTITVTIP